MHVVSRKKLKEFAKAYPASETALESWYRLVKNARWSSFADVRSDYPSVDQVGSLAVFNIGGNKFRLIAVVMIKAGKVYIRAILTHAEYDRGSWKGDQPKPKGTKKPKEKE
ncbi:mRNA interferase HigB [Singulisphaera sp. GP187]|uniref:type II toxin-antitoxin system HigB family toxin n=1 Tax=Singulisphaera sp. GP187 TaxID=1882752 RepID=UPI00092A6989|nr:type II toxin-antitoxin system HigB family toxin [Singulisphaera sp. GP187]SIO30697.1 mRNA interferase HigB [Singulisphaera sp. GP187]